MNELAEMIRRTRIGGTLSLSFGPGGVKPLDDETRAIQEEVRDDAELQAHRDFDIGEDDE